MFALAAARAPLALRPSTAAPRTQSRRSLVVRASEGEKETPSSGTVFFKGNAISEEEVSFRPSRHTETLKQHPRALLTTCRAFCVAAVWRQCGRRPAAASCRFAHCSPALLSLLPTTYHPCPPPTLQWKKASAEGIKPAATPDYSLKEAAAEPQSLGQVSAYPGRVVCWHTAAAATETSQPPASESDN